MNGLSMVNFKEKKIPGFQRGSNDYLIILGVSKAFNTVNSEIFARVLFTRNFAYAKFRENKILAKCPNPSVV